VFLHEGLGSLRLWREFPDAVRAAVGGPRTLVYSRHGYGRSAPVRRPRPVSYMHDEALNVLPEILDRLSVHRPVLIGHSDGASIALIHAGGGFPVAGLVLLAPHVSVEDRTIRGIRAAQEAFRTTDMPERMRRHHADPAATFWGWSEAWLDPAFRDWSIEEMLPRIESPVLVVQGTDDRYGTLAHLRAIEREVAGPVRTVVLEGVGHAPHLEAPAETLGHISSFITKSV